MRVVVNQLAALGQKTGIGHYTVELLRCLHEQAGTDQIDGFPQGWVRRTREACARMRPFLEGTGRQPTHPSAGSRWTSWRGYSLRQARNLGRALIAQHFRLVAKLRGYQLYHETNFIPLPCELPTLATIHDLSVILHPEWHPMDRVAHFEKYFSRGLRRCIHFLAISEFGRQEIIQKLHIPPERVTRTYMGTRPGLSPLPREQVSQLLGRLNLPSQYLLYLGTLEPRKNILLLLQAYCALPAALRGRWPLLLVGNWGWNAGPVIEYLHREARHRGVIHIGYVAEEHLAAIYSGARALVFPSLYEGFGLPPVEMMACGGAVLASTAGALIETVGSRAHLIDPHDLDGWRAAMARAVQDEDWWQALREGVRAVARPYAWDRCAADTLKVYRTLCSEHTEKSTGLGAAA
jgi:alpha-1,3-rhamnosyl/mannosyltransferase